VKTTSKPNTEAGHKVESDTYWKSRWSVKKAGWGRDRGRPNRPRDGNRSEQKNAATGLDRRMMSGRHSSEPAAARSLKGFFVVGLDVTGLRKLDFASVKT